MRIRGQPPIANGHATTDTYDDFDRRTRLSLPNGVVSTYGYDGANRLTTLTHVKSPTTLGSFTYGYDPLGNRTSLTDSLGAHTLTYDPLSQLTQATTPTVTWAYDAVGNRTTAAGQTYLPNTLNQYSQVAGVPHTWDLDGNLTNDGSATYQYDAENRLTQVIKGATTVSFTYDAFGRRASKTVNGVTTKFLYDGADLLAETNGAGTITARYLYGPRIDEPLERKAGTTTTSYSTDGLGSIALLTTSTGTLAESYTYDPFGLATIRNSSGTIIPTSALGNPFAFTGREWDSETGLFYYRARYYSPKIGRFVSRDPLGSLPDPNLFRYVGNNPLTFVDPWGLFPQLSSATGPSVGRLLGMRQPSLFAPQVINQQLSAPGLVLPLDALGRHSFELPKPIKIIIITGGIILGPVIGPIPGIPGTGKPIGPQPRPPVELPMPPDKPNEGRKDDEEEQGEEKSATVPIPTPGSSGKK